MKPGQRVWHQTDQNQTTTTFSTPLHMLDTGKSKPTPGNAKKIHTKGKWEHVSPNKMERHTGGNNRSTGNSSQGTKRQVDQEEKCLGKKLKIAMVDTWSKGRNSLWPQKKRAQFMEEKCSKKKNAYFGTQPSQEELNKLDRAACYMKKRWMWKIRMQQP